MEGQRRFGVIVVVSIICCGAVVWRSTVSSPKTVLAMQSSVETVAGKFPLTSAAVGHEYYQDDWPSIAVSPNGSVWLAWLSFDGEHDRIGLRRYQNGAWNNLQWVPGTSGDNMMPQVAVDASKRVWVAWSEQISGNWDMYARRFDPVNEQWDKLVRLTDNPLPDVNPRIWSDGKGHAALVWQGFRGRNSNIFLRTLETERWSPEIRVTNRAANDWEPAAAMDDAGSVWVTYDSYRNGNYDVYLRRITSAHVVEPEISVAVTPRFEARPTIAIDTEQRVWVAWESGPPNWGKDLGYIIKDTALGAVLGGERQTRIRCYENGRWQEPETPLSSAYPADPSFQPQVFSDGHGSVWVISKLRRLLGPPPPPPPPNMHQNLNDYFEYWVTHWDGQSWSTGSALPHGRGRDSTRLQAVLSAQGNVWLAWSTDNRTDAMTHRPRHEQIFAGLLDETGLTDLPPRWKDPTDAPITAPLTHPHEAEDVRRIREYRTLVDGQREYILRGDLHRHTELSWDGGGRDDGTLLDLYRYMLDVACLDFGATTDHQGGGWPYWWYYTQKMTDMFTVSGTYIGIFGFERSVPFPNGHRNVLFAKRSQSRVIPFFVKATADKAIPPPAGGDEPEVTTRAVVANDTKMMYEEIRPLHGISISHSPGMSQGTDWRDNDPELEPVVEIFQGARSSFEMLGAPHVVPGLAGDAEFSPEYVRLQGHRPEGMVANAWAKGYRLGVIASSDHFSTHISYAMVYTADGSREGILDAIRKRHTYGAMDNIILDVSMGTHFMGDEFSLSAPMPLRVKAHGTRIISRVWVIRDGRVIYTIEPDHQDVHFDFKDYDINKGHHYYYVRVEQDNTLLAWSSPMFIEYK